ncbi:MAG: PspC domain-containing protein [Paludibacteraceae bacterium]|nr:PspC domain-containing protein [Paludibacteraceae bacterium]
MANEKKLTRSTNKVLAGVCGGIAEYFEIDPTLVRVAYAALTVFSAGFPGVLLYIIMLIIMPQGSDYEQMD